MKWSTITALIVIWGVSTALALIGASFGHDYVKSDYPASFAQAIARWDGANYVHIAEDGYSYEVGKPSYVAFFPAFPMAIRWLSRCSHLSGIAAGAIISNLCILAATVLMGRYMHGRGDGLSGACGGPESLTWRRELAVATMLLSPMAFYFHMVYSESMFLLCTLVVFTCTVSESGSWAAIVAAGAATAVRPVGICLLPVIAMREYSRLRSKRWRDVLARAAYVIPTSCWGLLLYMGFQYHRFGQPFAFALTQKYHRVRPLGSTLSDKLLSLLSLEPIRAAYDPQSSAYWASMHFTPNRLFSPEFLNPIFFLSSALLVCLGAYFRWLNRYEVVFGLLLVGMCYFAKAFEMEMLSQARFTLVNFPIYIVLANILGRMRPLAAVALLALSAFLMGAYAAMFAANYPFF